MTLLAIVTFLPELFMNKADSPLSVQVLFENCPP